MAIQEQVEILRQGVTAWNQWIAQHRYGVIDLSGADFSGADLSEVDLVGADLSGAFLSDANLRAANLSSAFLSGADFSGADLKFADLSISDLSRADFNGADLYRANFREANLRDVDFSGADLRNVDFSGADLSGADLSNTIIGFTSFDGLDLRTVKGLETVRHEGPSFISTNTLERSQGDIPEVFLRGAGLNDPFIEYVRSLVAHPIEYYTCFLSYSSKDQDFAERLYADLQSKGVRCWMAPYDLRPGDYHHSRIDEAIRVHEKVLLFLSEHAVNSSWVKHEVQIALAREIAQDCTILFPLRLDEEVMHTSKDWAAQLRESRHIGDFTGWKDHDAYQTAFQRLLHDLKAES